MNIIFIVCQMSVMGARTESYIYGLSDFSDGVGGQELNITFIVCHRAVTGQGGKNLSLHL